MIDESTITRIFEAKFATSPNLIARAPGRVNLIGEHTDYNGGFVLPAAIDREMKLAARVGGDSVRVWSEEFGALYEFPSSALPEPGGVDGWRAYFVAVLARFRERGFRIPGMMVAATGDVPLGAGLSSSAAFAVAVATLVNHVCGAGLSPRDIAVLAQEAEHSAYIGVKCGIMDQFISAMGEEGNALLIDCHTLDAKLVPLDPTGATILIINSMKKRGLVDSEYNKRREECAAALKTLSELGGEDYPSLRHVPVEVFDRHADSLAEGPRRRARHAITENHRVETFAREASAGRWTEAGVALKGSHASLRDDYQVSCAELDFLAEAADTIDGVHGCRMTGAGFGGCAVALVVPEKANAAAAEFQRRFEKEFGVRPDVHLTRPGAGARVHYVEGDL